MSGFVKSEATLVGRIERLKAVMAEWEEELEGSMDATVDAETSAGLSMIQESLQLAIQDARCKLECLETELAELRGT